MTPSEFKELIESKPRDIYFTKHAENRALQRFLSKMSVETDLFQNIAVKVLEQPSENSEERVFDVYFIQTTGVFHRYVVSLNSLIRVITLMRVKSTLQKLVSRQAEGELIK